MPETYTLLTVAIGPVQDFIASARRCQDLWFGSWMLSELATAAAEKMEEMDAEALIFPGAVLGERDADTSVANKLLARVAGGLSRAREVAEAGRDALAARLSKMRVAAFRELGKDDPQRAHHFDERRAEAQIAELVEYVWAAVPEAGDYATARRQVDRLLVARKNTRIFAQPSWAAPVPKSSLDGARESVLHEDLFDKTRRGILDAEKLRRWYGVHPSERLCGVGLLKRHGPPDVRGWEDTMAFFSTSHLAARPLMLRLEDRRREIETLRCALRESLGTSGFVENAHVKRQTGAWQGMDGALLFESRIESIARENRRDSARALAALADFRSATGSPEPLPYYALLMADGDRMGRAIEQRDDFEVHRALSRRLTDFAREAGRLVKANHGSPIYAGGDDVLAYLPLHRVLDCADALREAFDACMMDFRSADGPTLSVGIAIVHHLEPMGQALDLVRRAEKLAKGSRNALAVILDKRGGSPIEVAGRWDEQPLPLRSRLAKMVELHRRDAISDRAGFELLALGKVVNGTRGPGLTGRVVDPAAEPGVPRAVIAADVARILARKQPRGEENRRIAADLVEELHDWLAQADRLDPERLGAELAIARLLQRAHEQASGEGA